MLATLLLQGIFTIVELNAENLFDCVHDSLKQDYDFLPTSAYKWTHTRYWRKVNRIGQVIVASTDSTVKQLPDLVALCEVENDSVLTDLTRKSLLRGAYYSYVMTHSPDLRGIDVALLYCPYTFNLLESHSISIPCLKDFGPTRDILYAKGVTAYDDTLHVFVVHAPSRTGGELASRPYRMHVVKTLLQSVDSVRDRQPEANIIVTGDFNDYSDDKPLRHLTSNGLTELSKNARGLHVAKGTYRYHGLWGSLDHIFISGPWSRLCQQCYVFDASYLLEPDTKYGGYKPRRNYQGPKYLNGFSDHLPLVTVFKGEP